MCGQEMRPELGDGPMNLDFIPMKIDLCTKCFNRALELNKEFCEKSIELRQEFINRFKIKLKEVKQ